MHENIERVLVSEEELHRINARLGAQITTDYAGKKSVGGGYFERIRAVYGGPDP